MDLDFVRTQEKVINRLQQQDHQSSSSNNFNNSPEKHKHRSQKNLVKELADLNMDDTMEDKERKHAHDLTGKLGGNYQNIQKLFSSKEYEVNLPPPSEIIVPLELYSVVQEKMFTYKSELDELKRESLLLRRQKKMDLEKLAQLTKHRNSLEIELSSTKTRVEQLSSINSDLLKERDHHAAFAEQRHDELEFARSEADDRAERLAAVLKDNDDLLGKRDYLQHRNVALEYDLDTHVRSTHAAESRLKIALLSTAKLASEKRNLILALEEMRAFILSGQASSSSRKQEKNHDDEKETQHQQQQQYQQEEGQEEGGDAVTSAASSLLAHRKTVSTTENNQLQQHLAAINHPSSKKAFLASVLSGKGKSIAESLHNSMLAAGLIDPDEITSPTQDFLKFSQIFGEENKMNNNVYSSSTSSSAAAAASSYRKFNGQDDEDEDEAHATENEARQAAEDAMLLMMEKTKKMKQFYQHRLRILETKLMEEHEWKSSEDQRAAVRALANNIRGFEDVDDQQETGSLSSSSRRNYKNNRMRMMNQQQQQQEDDDDFGEHTANKKVANALKAISGADQISAEGSVSGYYYDEEQERADFEEEQRRQQFEGDDKHEHENDDNGVWIENKAGESVKAITTKNQRRAYRQKRKQSRVLLGRDDDDDELREVSSLSQISTLKRLENENDEDEDDEEENVSASAAASSKRMVEFEQLDENNDNEENENENKSSQKSSTSKKNYSRFVDGYAPSSSSSTKNIKNRKESMTTLSSNFSSMKFGKSALFRKYFRDPNADEEQAAIAAATESILSGVRAAETMIEYVDSGTSDSLSLQDMKDKWEVIKQLTRARLSETMSEAEALSRNFSTLLKRRDNLKKNAAAASQNSQQQQQQQSPRLPFGGNANKSSNKFHSLEAQLHKSNTNIHNKSSMISPTSPQSNKFSVTPSSLNATTTNLSSPSSSSQQQQQQKQKNVETRNVGIQCTIKQRPETAFWCRNTLLQPEDLKDIDGSLYALLPKIFFELHNVIHDVIKESRKRAKLTIPIQDASPFIGDGETKTIADVHCAIKFDLFALMALRDLLKTVGRSTKGSIGASELKDRLIWYKEVVESQRLIQLEEKYRVDPKLLNRLNIVDRRALQQFRTEMKKRYVMPSTLDLNSRTRGSSTSKSKNEDEDGVFLEDLVKQEKFSSSSEDDDNGDDHDQDHATSSTSFSPEEQESRRKFLLLKKKQKKMKRKEEKFLSHLGGTEAINVGASCQHTNSILISRVEEHPPFVQDALLNSHHHHQEAEDQEQEQQQQQIIQTSSPPDRIIPKLSFTTTHHHNNRIDSFLESQHHHQHRTPQRKSSNIVARTDSNITSSNTPQQQQQQQNINNFNNVNIPFVHYQQQQTALTSPLSQTPHLPSISSPSSRNFHQRQQHLQQLLHQQQHHHHDHDQHDVSSASVPPPPLTSRGPLADAMDRAQQFQPYFQSPVASSSNTGRSGGTRTRNFNLSQQYQQQAQQQPHSTMMSNSPQRDLNLSLQVTHLKKR